LLCQDFRVRRRWWVAAVAAVVAVVVIVVLATSGGDPGVTSLERVVTAENQAPDSDLVFDAVLDGDMAYFAYTVGGSQVVAAYRAGADEPAWELADGGTVTEIQLAEADGVLLVMSLCAGSCDRLMGIDTRDGERLWTSDLPAFEVVGAADGHVAMQLMDQDRHLTDAVGIEARTGRIAWRVDGTDGRDRFEMVEGTSRLVHYAHAGELRLLDLATGRAEVTAEAEPFVRGDSATLTASAEDVVLELSDDNEVTSTVYAGDDLSERWSRDATVYVLAPGVFYAEEGTDGLVLDADGQEKWRTEGQVFTGYDGPVEWVYTSAYQGDGQTTRNRYFDLDSGDELAEHDRTIALSEPDGVLLVNSLATDASATFQYLAMPSGDLVDLGTHDVRTGSCAYGHSHLACLDTRSRFGIWRYR
jgi:PQQ-like domain